ncbi:MAG: hypothetical protein GWM90_24880, partial [Gemmatimonadetes bacterium]|nr:SAM-dependent chlorinase/fluorinase [Gemmatimonadota bacterium]NIQ58020.1 SAM-dependent chlorinase/fluorinase [Gemmatimonadota bacterium]NIU78201.1 hypothetical protein [Gammaproteobacteria bacterium]NIX47192.1 hypothetical protein [Gemmatimonadota bacterium]NIY11570.1 hypothetical protein [Gemmatimonadota bacterium]
DVFAPAAAHLVGGGALDALGPPADDLVRLPLPEPEAADGLVRGTVLAVDRFGNLVTNIPRAALPPEVSVVVEDRSVGPVR